MQFCYVGLFFRKLHFLAVYRKWPQKENCVSYCDVKLKSSWTLSERKSGWETFKPGPEPKKRESQIFFFKFSGMLGKIRGKSLFSPKTLLWLARARFIRIFAITFGPSRAFQPPFFKAIFGLFSLIFWKKIKNKSRVLNIKLCSFLLMRIWDVLYEKNSLHANIASVAEWLRWLDDFCL